MSVAIERVCNKYLVGIGEGVALDNAPVDWIQLSQKGCGEIQQGEPMIHNQTRKLLVASGSHFGLLEAAEILRGEFEVLEARNVSDVMAIARQDSPELILMDTELGDGCGFMACRRLMSIPGMEEVPIIFMTSSTLDNIHDRAFGYGGVDLIQKPLRRAELRSRVRNQFRLQCSKTAIRRRALYDGLTDLPNRDLTLDRLREALLWGQRDGLHTALMFIDLDHFKDINDSLGHEAGDQLLAQAALRLRKPLRRADTVGRLGGDEFAIILPGLQGAEDTRVVAAALLREFEQPFFLNGVHHQVGLSIGIATCPGDGTDAAKLMACADAAMYQTKREGRGSFRFYAEKMNADDSRRVALEAELRHAVERDEFSLHYQPVIELKSGTVVGAEALLRWNNPRLGLVPPQDFIRRAEHSGVICAIGEFVLRRACADFCDLVNEYGEPFRLSVNVSGQQIRNPQFARSLNSILDETAFPASRLELEVTESLILCRNNVIRDRLAQLRSMGLRLSLDDFGEDYCSLTHLARHHFHAMKIDRHLVVKMGDSPEHDALVRALIASADALQVPVVAEGVETRAQLRQLEERNCAFAQGNWFYPPMPIADFCSQIPNSCQPDRRSTTRLRLVRSGGLHTESDTR